MIGLINARYLDKWFKVCPLPVHHNDNQTERDRFPRNDQTTPYDALQLIWDLTLLMNMWGSQLDNDRLTQTEKSEILRQMDGACVQCDVLRAKALVAWIPTYNGIEYSTVRYEDI